MKLNNYLDIDEKQLNLFNDFYLLHKNATLNLTSIKEKEDFYVKHYLDSAYIFALKNFKYKNLLDVGSGGGFPGIVIAIINPSAEITLVESKKKKCDFLLNCIDELNLRNVNVINERVENLKNKYFDIITARGVGKTSDLLKLTKNVSRETTVWIFYKGEKIKDELFDAKKYLNKYKLKVENVRIETPFKRTYTIISHGSVV